MSCSESELAWPTRFSAGSFPCKCTVHKKRCTLLVPSRAMWPQPGRQRGKIAPCEVHPVAKGSYFHCVHGVGCFHPLAELHISEEQFSNNSRTREFVNIIFMFERCTRSEPSFVCDLSAREINNSSGLTKLLRSLMQSPTFRNAGRSMHMMLHRFLGFRELTVHMIAKIARFLWSALKRQHENININGDAPVMHENEAL